MSVSSRLRVMLVDNEPERARMVCLALESEGYQVISQRDSALGLTAAVARDEPDVVIIDMDSPDRDTLENMSVLSEHAPRPIVFFASAAGDSQTIQAAVRAGVSAYVVDGLQPKRVRSVVDVAIARFQEFQALRAQLLETRTALDERKLIDRAKGLVMRHQGCDEDEAYRTLRKLAMDRSEKLSAVARYVIGALGPGSAANAGSGEHP